MRRVMTVVFVDDGMDHDGLFMDGECGVCGDGDPVVCLVGKRWEGKRLVL